MSETNTNSKKKQLIEKIIIITLALLVIVLLVFFLKDIVFEFVKLQINNDVDGAKELLKSKGVLGYASISLIEALQMIVIFIPAEFIQLTSGMSYPWYVALALCDLGVILGSSIIYFIVHVFKFNGDILNKSDKIVKYDKGGTGEKSIMILMYFLFFMPIIPFGAICYYASNKKIRYHKYVFTCATAVIPSIFTSILMGTAVKEFIANSLPLPLLILAIFLAGAILFIAIFFILNKFYFKDHDYTPDSVFYNPLRNFMRRRVKRFTNLHINKGDIEKLNGPYILLSNHSCYYDFYFIDQIREDTRYSFVVNRHYFGMPILGKLARRIGFIPKKIFNSDLETIKLILKYRDMGYPIMMFPEGILSPDGTLQKINESVTTLLFKLNIPVVLVNINNAYLFKPKWRKQKIKTDVYVNVNKIIMPEELANYTNETLYQEVVSNLDYKAYYEENIYKSNKKANKLEYLLYGCPECKTLYKMSSKNNQLYCHSCGKTYNLLDNYYFDDAKIKTIPDYVKVLKQNENINNLHFTVTVDTVIFEQKKNKKKKDKGVITLTNEKIEYRSLISDYEFEIALKNLEGIAYSTGVEFEFYYDNKLHYFYPIKYKEDSARISILFDILKKREY